MNFRRIRADLVSASSISLITIITSSLLLHLTYHPQELSRLLVGSSLVHSGCIFWFTLEGWLRLCDLQTTQAKYTGEGLGSLFHFEELCTQRIHNDDCASRNRLNKSKFSG